DGTVALAGRAVSDDGKRLAYGVSASGSDWQEWRVRDIDTGKDLPDLIRWVKFSSASWSKDGRGFFYSLYDEPNEQTKMEQANYSQKLFYHRLGSRQSEDVLVYERRDQKDWLFSGAVSDDGNYLLIHVSQGTDSRNRFFYRDLSRPGSKVVELINQL